jgi:hypothetical protein
MSPIASRLSSAKRLAWGGNFPFDLDFFAMQALRSAAILAAILAGSLAACLNPFVPLKILLVKVFMPMSAARYGEFWQLFWQVLWLVCFNGHG